MVFVVIARTMLRALEGITVAASQMQQSGRGALPFDSAPQCDRQAHAHLHRISALQPRGAQHQARIRSFVMVQ